MVSLIQALQEKADAVPHKNAFALLDRRGREKETISFAELDQRARSAAGCFQQMGLAGKPMVILLKTRIKFIVCFFGCIYAGVLPVPMPIPRHGKSWARLKAVAGGSGATHILTDRATLDRLGNETPDQGAMASGYTWLAAEDVLAESASPWHRPELGGHDLALLQFTSGSTGNPKGVMISHGNLLENTRDFSAHFGVTRESVGVSWLPLFHDMGLVAHVVQPVVLGCTAVLLEPSTFIMQPRSWLRAISDHGADFSGAPNFAYELCLRQIPETEDASLDLSSWRTAYCGAEPVRAATLERFHDRFCRAGFRREFFYPVYGLSEATLMVAGKRAGQKYRTLRRTDVAPDYLGGYLSVRRELVSCGQATGGQHIRIIDPASHAPLGEGRIGEIWVSGDNVAKGYWRNPADTAKCFVQQPGGGPDWFRTGDLGFLENGHLYIAGRIKDTLIVNGVNYSAEDMEYALALCHPGLAIGGCAVFAMETPTGEQPVAACEVAVGTDLETMRAILEAACKTMSESFGVPLYDLVFSGPGKLPRTTSGKVQRHVCRMCYLGESTGAAFHRVAHPGLTRSRWEADDEPRQAL